MTHRIGRPLILTALAALTSACVIDAASDNDLDDAATVRANAALAAQECGQGRVKSVGLEGFACKEAGE